MKNKLLKKIALASTVLVASLPVFANQPSPELRLKMEKIGEIKDVQPTASKDIFAWTFAKNGKTLVLYNTPDQKHFIQGTIFNIDSKKSVTSNFPLDSLKYASPEFKNRVLKTGEAPRPNTNTQLQNQANNIGLMNLKWDKQIPEALKLLDSLASAKQGKGSPQDTLYIFYDPRCTWCHQTYNALQPYVEKGYTIKWIPTTALGKSPDALALASAPLQNINLLGASFDKTLKAKSIKPTEKNIRDIDENFQFLRAYFSKVIPEQRPSVPLAILLDKRSGKITHKQGLTDKIVQQELFGDK